MSHQIFPNPVAGGGSVDTDTLATELDVSMGSISDKDVLTFNQSLGFWTNEQPLLANDADVAIPSPSDGDVLSYNASLNLWTNKPLTDADTLATLSDVSVISPSDGDVLTYSHSMGLWINQAPTGGGSSFTVVTTAINYTAASFDDVWASGTINITTPSATVGHRIKVTNRGSGTITVLPASGTISGQASYQLKRQYTAIELVSDGTNWAIE